MRKHTKNEKTKIRGKTKNMDMIEVGGGFKQWGCQ